MVESELKAEKPLGLVQGALARLIYKRASVITNEALSQHFRLLSFESPGLEKTRFVPGEVIQVRAESVFSRTYTAILDPDAPDRLRLLAYLHGGGPGSDWFARARSGSVCEFKGPKDSMDLTGFGSEILITGDETSLGLIAAARASGIAAKSVLEVTNPPEAKHVLDALAIPHVRLLERRPSDAHLAGMEKLLSEATGPRTIFVLTGRAASIQAMRKALKALQVPSNRMKSKAYWAPGKTGMD